MISLITSSTTDPCIFEWLKRKVTFGTNEEKQWHK